MEATKIIVSVKWNKQLFEGVELDMSQDVETFKAQIYALTMVPVEKQKVMCKGKLIKEGNPWSAYPALKAGAQLMLMGTAEGNELKKPETAIKFVEDMTDAERAAALQEKAGIVIPAGLDNLGNTCYMNSVVQCLKRVDELKDMLKGYQLDMANHGGMVDDLSVQLTCAARQLMKDLTTKGAPFPPEMFVAVMKKAFPMFDERDDKGHPKQQDADECYSLFMQAFQQAMSYAKKDEKEDEKMLVDDSVSANPIERLFQIEFETKTQNKEIEAEEAKIAVERAMKLRCYIDNNNNPIDTIEEGLDIGLKGELEKYSEIAGRNCVYEKTQKINQLPGYLCVNFVRFYWKAASQIGGTKAGKAKILKKVIYPRVLDIYKFCSDELKKSLDHGRALEAKMREAEDVAKLEGKKAAQEKADAIMKGDEPEPSSEERQQARLVGEAAKRKMKADEEKLHDQILYRPHGQGLDNGNYELVAVITHKGRSAEGGHYISWVHAAGDEWVCFDDDIVTTVKTEQVMGLCGGGDWHTAYLAIYRKLEAVDQK